MNYVVDVYPPNRRRPAYLMVGKCLLTGRMATRTTENKPQEADFGAVIKQLQGG